MVDVDLSRTHISRRSCGNLRYFDFGLGTCLSVGTLILAPEDAAAWPATPRGCSLGNVYARNARSVHLRALNSNGARSAHRVYLLQKALLSPMF